VFKPLNYMAFFKKFHFGRRSRSRHPLTTCPPPRIESKPNRARNKAGLVSELLRARFLHQASRGHVRCWRGFKKPVVSGLKRNREVAPAGPAPSFVRSSDLLQSSASSLNKWRYAEAGLVGWRSIAGRKPSCSDILFRPRDASRRSSRKMTDISARSAPGS
jgi:hypothetical protein